MVKCNTSNVDLSVRFRYATLIKYNNYENYIRNKAEDEGSIPFTRSTCVGSVTRHIKYCSRGLSREPITRNLESIQGLIITPSFGSIFESQ